MLHMISKKRPSLSLNSRDDFLFGIQIKEPVTASPKPVWVLYITL